MRKGLLGRVLWLLITKKLIRRIKLSVRNGVEGIYDAYDDCRYVFGLVIIFYGFSVNRANK